MSLDDLIGGRDQLSSGIYGRRAQNTLFAVEQRTAYIQSQSRYLLEIFLHREAQNPGANLFEKWRYAQYDRKPTLSDLERYAPQWRDLLPKLPDQMAAFVYTFAKKYPFGTNRAALRDTLRLDEPAVGEAYQKLYKQPISSIYSEENTPSAARQTITTEMLSLIETQIEWQTLTRGVVLYQQGDPSDALYVVIHGRLLITQTDERGRLQILRSVARGEMIGETAFVGDSYRTATVQATRDSLVMRVPREAFERLTTQYPRQMLDFLQGLVARIRTTTPDRAVARRMVTAAVIPLNGASVAPLIERLSTALSTYGSVLHLNPAKLSDLLGSDALSRLESDAERAASVAWLNEQEAAYRFVLYECDPTLTAWTDRAIRQADRVLLVTESNTTPDLTALERQLNERPVADSPWSIIRKELVLIRSAGQPIRGSAKWLTARANTPAQITQHHHIDPTQSNDYQRMGRRLAGYAIGLVLGGGGARCFAHVGVIKALREMGLPIDVVGGTSAGAIAAAAVAMGASSDQLIEYTRVLFKSFSDYTLPMTSIFTGHNFTRALQEMCGDRFIEDLPIGYFAVSSNLTQAKMHLHQSGQLWRTLRASASLPGAFPPIMEGEDLLIDGAIFDNVPVRPMSELLEGGMVIACDVEDSTIRRRSYQYGESLNGWLVLAGRLFPPLRKRYKAPTLIGLMSRATVLASMETKQTTRTLAELYLNPPVGKFGTFDLDACDEMIQIAYEYAKTQLTEWEARQAHAPLPVSDLSQNQSVRNIS
jgi:predicted acylesterase/phospholipase RssA/CRP-like cAMP-binding protein